MVHSHDHSAFLLLFRHHSLSLTHVCGTPVCPTTNTFPTCLVVEYQSQRPTQGATARVDTRIEM